MALPKVEEARQLDDQALDEAIVATKRRLFELRFQKATRQLESGLHQFKHERHRLAQLMTVRQERLLATVPTADETGSEATPTPVQSQTTSIAEEE
ncbi:MAG: 50S ribosomal protein L29 [Cyanobacteria bacterium P01_F01_bin.86]